MPSDTHQRRKEAPYLELVLSLHWREGKPQDKTIGTTSLRREAKNQGDARRQFTGLVEKGWEELTGEAIEFIPNIDLRQEASDVRQTRAATMGRASQPAVEQPAVESEPLGSQAAGSSAPARRGRRRGRAVDAGGGADRPATRPRPPRLTGPTFSGPSTVAERLEARGGLETDVAWYDWRDDPSHPQGGEWALVGCICLITDVGREDGGRLYFDTDDGYRYCPPEDGTEVQIADPPANMATKFTEAEQAAAAGLMTTEVVATPKETVQADDKLWAKLQQHDKAKAAPASAPAFKAPLPVKSAARASVEDWELFAAHIDDLLGSGEYDWAEDSLAGIAETVRNYHRVTDRQRTAVSNIEDAGERQRDRRRYEGWGR